MKRKELFRRLSAISMAAMMTVTAVPSNIFAADIEFTDSDQETAEADVDIADAEEEPQADVEEPQIEEDTQEPESGAGEDDVFSDGAEDTAGDAADFQDDAGENTPAADATVHMTISVAGVLADAKDGTAMAQRDVTVKDLDGNGILTYDEALSAAHDEYYEGGAAAGYASADSQYGLMITKLWGDTSGAFGYWTNDASCNSLSDPVKADDYLTAFIYKDQSSYSDSYTRFGQKEYEATSGEAFTVSVDKASYDENYNTVFAAYDGAGLTAYDSEYKPLAAEAYSVDGYNVTFNQAGTYYLATAGTDSVNLVPAVAKVTVNKLSGSGTQEEPYQIKTAEDYQYVADLVAQGNSFEGVYLRQENDITLPDGWKPIGVTKDGTNDIKRGQNLNAFSGILDGNNKTLTIPEGGLPLLGYVKNAEVRNLNIYGTKIAGYGLVNNFEGVGLSGNAITIENVTLKSGSSTLKSGFLGANITTNGYAGCSAGFVATLRNCTVEEGVVVGYDKDQTMIGSFAGRMQGTIENCVSHATVYGKDYVGGIIGTRDNSMGNCIVSGCEFNGTVEASGEHAGGIAGGGYENSSAPNGIKITINNCNVGGNIIGADKVGGILGGDSYVAQAWNEYSMKGNSFTGKVQATGENASYIGGIIGFYDSLNKFDDITDNYYAKDCGADRGIGFVQYIDTNCTTHETASGATYFSTEENTDSCPTVQYCSWKAQHNRTDDPLGADASKLASTEKAAQNIKVHFMLLGDQKHDSDTDKTYHTLHAGNLETWIADSEYEVGGNATVLDVIAKVLTENEYSFENAKGNYISSVTKPDGTRLAEKDNGANSGWMYTLNGLHPDLAVNEQYLEDGDTIVFHYTDDYTKEHDHIWSSEWTSDKDAHWHECIYQWSACDITDNTKKNGYGAHTFDEGKVTKEATYTTEGVKTYTCTVCGYEKTEKIPVVPHSHKYTWKTISKATVFQPQKQQGTCSICKKTTTRTYGSKLKATIKLNVSSITLQKKQATKRVRVTMANGDSIKSWSSSNRKTVTVDKNGLIRAQNRTGSAKITVTLKSGKKAVLNVKVQAGKVRTTKISGLKSSMTLKKGQKTTLKPVISPLTSLEKVTYTSSNKNVAAVSSKGVIAAKKKGTAKITVKSGKKSYVIKVTVK